jgi:hypothetical protein
VANALRLGIGGAVAVTVAGILGALWVRRIVGATALFEARGTGLVYLIWSYLDLTALAAALVAFVTVCRTRSARLTLSLLATLVMVALTIPLIPVLALLGICGPGKLVACSSRTGTAFFRAFIGEDGIRAPVRASVVALLVVIVFLVMEYLVSLVRQPAARPNANNAEPSPRLRLITGLAGLAIATSLLGATYFVLAGWFGR